MAKFHVVRVRQQQFIERVEVERYPEAEIHHEIQLEMPDVPDFPNFSGTFPASGFFPDFSHLLFHLF